MDRYLMPKSREELKDIELEKGGKKVFVIFRPQSRDHFATVALRIVRHQRLD
jgi:hypothetical protein